MKRCHVNHIKFPNGAALSPSKIAGSSSSTSSTNILDKKLIYLTKVATNANPTKPKQTAQE